jgi:hypothetical protein
MDLDELSDELQRLEGIHVGVTSHAGALYAVGTLQIGVAQTRAIPKGTVVLTDELLASLPAEPDEHLKGFYVGTALIMLMPEEFVSARRTEYQIEIEMENESIFVILFREDPPYDPPIVELG